MSQDAQDEFEKMPAGGCVISLIKNDAEEMFKFVKSVAFGEVTFISISITTLFTNFILITVFL